MSQVAIVLKQKPSSEQEKLAVESLVNHLGVKEKTAKQILSNVPLKVYSQLKKREGRILVEALNLATSLQWEVMREKDVKFPAVNWNKRPTILGMDLDDLVAKNNPHCTGVAKLYPGLAEGFENPADKIEVKEEGPRPAKANIKKRSSTSGDSSSAHETSADTTILRTADSVITHLSADLEEAFRKKNLEGQNPNETLPLYGDDSQNIPGTRKSILEPGFYNLYLPPIKTNDARKQVEELCSELFQWDRETYLEAMAKPIVCIARNIDDIDATRLMERFAKLNITLNCKLRSKI